MDACPRAQVVPLPCFYSEFWSKTSAWNATTCSIDGWMLYTIDWLRGMGYDVEVSWGRGSERVLRLGVHGVGEVSEA